MAESKVNRENFIALQGWQVVDLGLKGNELIIYACIYGFSQDNQTFSGSLQYLADWTNSTKQGVMKCLKSLVEKGLIVKKENIINGVKFCEYYTTKFNGGMQQSLTPMQQSLTGGMQQSLPNNIDLDNIANNISNNKKKVSKQTFDNIISDYAKGNEEIKDLLGEWLKVRKAKRAAMTDRAIQMNIDKLDKLAAQSNMSVADYLKEVICRGWAAFYAINNYNNNYNKGQAPKKVDDATQKQVDAFLAANQQQPAKNSNYEEEMKRLMEENGLF